jgi:hypothetical protein
MFSIAILLMVSILVNAQPVAIKTKTYYLGDLGDKFYEKLGQNGRVLLDTLVKLEPFDTLGLIKTTSEDETKYASREYLSTHTYRYITIFKYGEEISIRRFSNDVESINDRRRIILKYSKDDSDTVNRISLHIIN